MDPVGHKKTLTPLIFFVGKYQFVALVSAAPQVAKQPLQNKCFRVFEVSMTKPNFSDAHIFPGL